MSPIRLVATALGTLALLSGASTAHAATAHRCASPAAAGAPAAVAPGVRPRDFWLTSTQAIAIAARQPAIRRLTKSPGLTSTASVAALGLWSVSFTRDGCVVGTEQVEDRTRDVLAPSQSAWPGVGSRLDSYKQRLELALAVLAAIFLAVLFDWRRPFRLFNLDLIAMLSFGASLLLFDRLHPLLSVPLIYPPLAYLFARLAFAGWRRAGAPAPDAQIASTRTLLGAIVLIEAGRIAFSFAFPATSDVSYASVFGANSIHHGLAVYTPAPLFHLDTYGPVNYIAYLPFELLFPMKPSWAHDYLPAAHAAALTFELATVAGLFALGARIRRGPAGRRLGAVLAFAWVAYPFTLFGLALNSNDGLIVALLVWMLVALSSPAIRGTLLGLAAAAKFSPLVLVGVIAAGGGERRRRDATVVAVAATTVIALSTWVLLPHPGGLALFWQKTLGYQLGRHSFMSLWGQHPGLEFLRAIVIAATLALAVAALLIPARRDTAQVAALVGAILVGVEICLRYWSFYYVAWFAPFALTALLAAGHPELAAATNAADWTFVRRIREKSPSPVWVGAQICRKEP